MTYRTSKPLHPTEFGGPEKTFRSAFSSAKKSGKKTFKHKGKSYTTQTAAEKAKKQSYDNMVKSWKSSGKKYKKNPSKSNKEIHKSYENEWRSRSDAGSPGGPPERIEK